MQLDDQGRPLPTITADNQPFWDACKAERLALPYCGACDRPFLPPAPVCPFCFAPSPNWRPASGKGVVSSWVVVHQPWFPAFADDLPYNVAQVELVEGPRLTTSLVGVANHEIEIGMLVEVEFVHVSRDVALPRFRIRSDLRG